MKTLSEFLELPEGVEFKISGINNIYKIENNILLYKSVSNCWLPSEAPLNRILKSKITILPQPLLTDEEREWLKNVISPFTNEVEDICITENGEEEVFLRINLKHEEPILFPIFEKGKYYNGLQIGENYTLADLGLEE